MRRTPGHRVAIAILVAAVVTAGCDSAPERAAAHVEHAARLMTEGELTKAGVELRNAIQLDPSRVDAMYQLAWLAERRGDLREAADLLQRIIAIDAAHDDARFALARLLVLAGNTDAALPLVEEGLARKPGEPRLLAVRAAARWLEGDAAGSRQDADVALPLVSEDPRAVTLLGALLVKQDRPDLAIRSLQPAAQRWPDDLAIAGTLSDALARAGRTREAESVLLDAGARSHESQLARDLLTSFYVATGQLDAAEASLREAVRTEPGDVRQIVALARFLATHRTTSAALDALEASIVARPDDLDIRMTAADFMQQNGAPTRAAELYRGIVEQDGMNRHGVEARGRLAILYTGTGEHDRALEHAESVLAANPADSDALLARGTIALARGDANAAVTDFRSVLRGRPDSVPVRRLLAQSLLRAGHADLAESTLREIVRGTPDDGAALADLAQLLLAQGRPADAVHALERASALDDPVLREMLFRGHAALGDWDAARLVAVGTTLARPDLALGYLQRATAALAQGRAEEARDALQRGLELQPDAVEPLGMLVRLQLQDGNTDEVHARLDRLIASSPDNVVALNLKGEALISERQFQAAVVPLTVVVEKAPTWWIGYRNLAAALVGAGRPEEALEAQEAGFRRTASPLLLVEMATVQERLGRSQDAIDTAERLRSAVPASDAAADLLARLLLAHGDGGRDLARAIEASERLAASPTPAYRETYDSVRRAHASAGASRQPATPAPGSGQQVIAR